jgi:signal transduction histidine kinase
MSIAFRFVSRLQYTPQLSHSLVGSLGTTDRWHEASIPNSYKIRYNCRNSFSTLAVSKEDLGSGYMTHQDEVVYEDIALHPLYRHREQALLHALLQSIDYGVLVSGLDRQDIVANRRLGELFSIPPRLVVESDPDTVRAWARSRVRHPARFEAMIQRAYADPYFTGEDEVELRETPPRFLRRFTAPVLDAQGNPIARLWTFLDISETKRLQAQVRRRLHKTTQILQETRRRLLEAEKLRVVGTLSASVAHDIRNILSTMRMEIEQLPSENATALIEQFHRFEVLAQRLLAMTHADGCYREQVSLNDRIRHVAPLLAAQADSCNVNLCYDLQEGLPAVLGDPVQIDRLLINLCLNAFQAMAAAGGTLTLRTCSKGEKVYLEVRDTGPGIAPEIKKQIFMPFFTTRSGGTGLGLYNCKRIVCEHNGRITVRSRPGKGACFIVMLPAAEGENG